MTKGQARLIVTEKIETELMSKFSPVLRKEIVGIKNNQNEIIVRFRSKSTIIVVIANDNARGNRSNVVVREEFRQIKKKIDDSILSPFQVIRQPPYIIDPYYANIKELQEEPVNIYISSSWLDPHWMWGIVDNAYEGMLNGTGEYLLAFDESITLKHNIRTQKQMQTERKKQDPFTWAVEFLNMRLKENQHAFFTYNMFLDNQKIKRPFYPRTTVDFKTGKKNPYDIPKQAGEIRVVACDMAFVTRDGNDNSVFSCMRLLPDYTTYNRKDDGDVLVENGFRKLIPYIESVQGGDTVRQALRIRQLFEDFHADYIVLDLRNAGISVYDILAREMYDDERDVYYSPLKCMNDDTIAARIRTDEANECIFVINASQKLNSEIALEFRRNLTESKIELLINYETAKEETLPNIKEYVSTPEADEQAFYEAPFLETQALISESTSLVYEKRPDTGAIVIHEQGANTKDRYTSCSYGCWFASLLERDNVSSKEEYEYTVFIN